MSATLSRVNLYEALIHLARFICKKVSWHPPNLCREYNYYMGPAQRLPYLWDYDLDETQFREILAGRRVLGRLDRDWAARRLLEYAPYEEIIRLLGFPDLIANWPRWRVHIRSKSRKRGFDFLVKWLPEKHPEVCHE
jgi:hypothetical protein